MMAKKSTLLVVIALAAVFVFVNIFIIFDKDRASLAPPKIHGVLIPEARNISEFSLIDHHGQTFSNPDLKNVWHIFSYGFTDCPDICPTTLSKLAKLEKKLYETQQYEDVRMLFYTIDPKRDTVERLSEYVQFFGKSFVGLTWGLELATNHVPLETSLGIVSSITPLPPEEAVDDIKGYHVSHGVMLYLINPEGKLQAIFKPHIDKHGVHSFSFDQIYRDYLAVRGYFG